MDSSSKETNPDAGKGVGRRSVLGMAAFPLLAKGAASTDKKPRAFRIDVPQATINRILTRVRDARWPDRIDAQDWSYGANWDYRKQLAGYWTGQFDWRRSEKNLNRYPQFLARVEDYDIHFFHVRGRGPRPQPLILTHGWPGSVYEFLEAMGPLSSDPARYGGSEQDAFDVIVPSLPGFGFSSKPKRKPIGPRTTARLWHKLMTTETLGYKQYGAQGGDWGYAVTASLAQQNPESVIGMHLNAAGAARFRSPSKPMKSAHGSGVPPSNVWRKWILSVSSSASLRRWLSRWTTTHWELPPGLPKRCRAGATRATILIKLSARITC